LTSGAAVMDFICTHTHKHMHASACTLFNLWTRESIQ